MRHPLFREEGGWAFIKAHRVRADITAEHVRKKFALIRPAGTFSPREKGELTQSRNAT